jgi:rhamnosyltransferase
MNLRIPIIIPTRNAGPLLDDVLSAIAGQSGRFEPQIVAIDSGSTDGTVDRLTRSGATIPMFGLESSIMGTREMTL